MLELFLVRHAQPDWEPEGKADDNPKLTALGERQAATLVQALGGLEFDRFICSPTRRTRETAGYLAERWGREPEVLDFLEEIRVPSLQAQPEEQVRAYFSTARSRPLDEWWVGVPGGESFREFHTRITTGLDGLLRELKINPGRHPTLWQSERLDGRHLIVSHAGTSSVIISHLLGLPPVPWEWERFPLAWASYAVLANNPAAGGQLWCLEKFNMTHHLGTHYRDHLRR